MSRSMRSSRYRIVLLLLAVAVVLSSESTCVTAWRPPLTIKYYVHDNIVPGHPNATSVQVASASGNDTIGPIPLFGDVAVFDSPMTEGPSNSSLLLGSQGGELASLKGDFHYWVTFTASFNTCVYRGTYSGQGQFNGAAPTHEVAVVGGTGDFRGARGYVVAGPVRPASGVDPTNSVMIYTAYLSF